MVFTDEPAQHDADGQPYEDLLREGQPLTRHTLRLRVFHPVRSSGGQRRAGIRRFYLEKWAAPADPTCRSAWWLSRCGRLSDLQCRAVLIIRNARSEDTAYERSARVGSRPAARASDCCRGGSDAGNRHSSDLPPTATNRASHCGHHGIARRAMGSTISTAAPSPWALITPQQRRTPVVTQLVGGICHEHRRSGRQGGAVCGRRHVAKRGRTRRADGTSTSPRRPPMDGDRSPRIVAPPACSAQAAPALPVPHPTSTTSRTARATAAGRPRSPERFRKCRGA